MQYEIIRESKIKQVSKKIHSWFEDSLLSVLMFLARILHSEKLNQWIASYTQKKIQRMQQELIKMKWNKIPLDKAVQSIHEKQSSQ